LKTLKSIEERQKEQKSEIDGQIRSMKQMVQENLPEMPAAYLKHIQEPVCEEVSVSFRCKTKLKLVHL